MDPLQTEIWDIARMIEWGSTYFKNHKVDSPRLTIELLVCYALSLERFDLYMKYDRPFSQDELSDLKLLITRRVAGEPLQYIVGEAPFHRRSFHVKPGVLIPRPETELLVDEAMRRTQPLRALDIGTGSGCIATTVALEKPMCEVIGIDVSKLAVEIAAENAKELGASNVQFSQIDFFDDDHIEELGTFDLVLCNPPYVSEEEFQMLEKEVKEHEPRIALTDEGDGLRFYKRLSERLSSLLRSNGEAYIELGYGQSETVSKLFELEGFETEVYSDFERVERILRLRNPAVTKSPF